MKTSPRPSPDPEPDHAPLLRRTPLAFAFAIVAAAALANPLSPSTHASTLTALDGEANDIFGRSASASGSGALVGAPGYPYFKNYNSSAYYYKGLDAVDPQDNPVTETVMLHPSYGAEGDYFGNSVSLWRDNALVGAYGADGKETDSGAAYYYKGLDLVNPSEGPVTETVKLLASDGTKGDHFGNSVSLSGANALVAASLHNNWSGAAYYYQGLGAVDPQAQSGPVYETVKLLASDGTADDQFGASMSLSGDNALVGAGGDDDQGTWSGAAYYYKGLDSVNPQQGPVYETVKLLASDGTAEAELGSSVSLSGDNALVSAPLRDNYRGVVYYYKGLNDEDPSEGPVYETVKLYASDVAEEDYFGNSVSLSGANALVGADYADGKETTNSGAAYYYKGLDKVPGKTTYETVKLFASDGAEWERFGLSVSLDGDRFVIGAYYASVDGVTRVGKAYAGDIRAFTTLDAGNGTALATDCLSFVSQTDWIIGAETANNTVTLTAGDTADVTLADKAVYIGQTAGADNNTLIIEGTLIATTVYVGAGGSDSPTTGATGNTLRLTTAALETLDVGTLYLDAGNFLEFENAGQELDINDVLTLLDGTATVQVRGSSNEGWVTLDAENAATLLMKTGVVDGPDGAWTRFTTISGSAVPEPATWAALAGLALLAYAVALRRPRGKRA
ncbi:MAG: FG-GAP repeat protein [Opitutaceae bacterium]|jgi:hypothetical protein|nr:FG-GAP repeat protein [Opitutaceae bacterium]